MWPGLRGISGSLELMKNAAEIGYARFVLAVTPPPTAAGPAGT
ncbi:hypothetical protein [Corallococcus macrosporus]|nr:hypothetical protein [Corallococcus macrosporus]